VPRTVRGQYPLTGFAGNGELIETLGGRDFGHPFFLAGGNQSNHMILRDGGRPNK
jgi:hypothetical protein